MTQDLKPNPILTALSLQPLVSLNLNLHLNLHLHLKPKRSPLPARHLPSGFTTLIKLNLEKSRSHDHNSLTP